MMPMKSELSRMWDQMGQMGQMGQMEAASWALRGPGLPAWCSFTK